MKFVNKKKGVDSWSHFLSMSLDGLRDRGLYRQLRLIDSPVAASVTIDGRPFLLFCSNDYLGLSRHPLLVERAAMFAGRFGAGATASRLICGNLPYFVKGKPRKEGLVDVNYNLLDGCIHA